MQESKKELSLYQQNETIMKATLKFSDYNKANDFAVAYKFATLSSPVVGDEANGITEVTVYNVDDKAKEFINNYIAKLN